MTLRRRRLAVCSLLILVSATGCGACGEPTLVFRDKVEPHDGPLEDANESLHTYATDAQVPIDVLSFGPFVDISTLSPSISGDAILDDSVDVSRTPNVLSFAIRTGGEDGGTLSIVDENGDVVDERTITVRAADAIALSLPVEDRASWQAPEIDLAGTRVFAGGKAAFRTRLTREGEEVHGLRSVVATPSDATVGTRQAVACAPAGCNGQRAATEIQIPEATTTPFDVVLTAGTASLTLVVEPTVAAEISGFVVEELPAEDQDTDISGTRTGIVVASSEAAGDPVYGVPVAWTFDGAEQETTGDLVRYEVDPAGELLPLTGAIGTRAASVSIRTAGELEVSSITAACSAGGGGHALSALALALLALSRRRRRAIVRG